MSHALAAEDLTVLRGDRRSKEFDLLCSCSGVELAPTRLTQIAAFIDEAIDWKEFLRLAEHHGVLPLAARNLSAASGVPPEVTQLLRSAFDANVRRNLWFVGELARIAEHFETNRVTAVPYKGPILAETAYGDVALRNFGDLDFLILPADFEKAKLTLANLGYRPSEALRPAVERFWLRHGYERSFDGPAGKYLVELQWALTARFFAVDLRAEDLLRRSQSATIGGQPIRSLSPEDTLLVLCLHAAKHLWMRLIWVCDIAETIRSQTIDHTLVLSRARELGIVRITLLNFWLAHRLLGCVLAREIRQAIESDQEVNVLGEELAARLARSATYDFESLDYFRWIPKLRERRSDRCRYYWRLVCTPGVGDLAAVRLPEALFPLYRLVRMARMARKSTRMATAGAAHTEN